MWLVYRNSQTLLKNWLVFEMRWFHYFGNALCMYSGVGLQCVYVSAVRPYVQVIKYILCHDDTLSPRCHSYLFPVIILIILVTCMPIV